MYLLDSAIDAPISCYLHAYGLYDDIISVNDNIMSLIGLRAQKEPHEMAVHVLFSLQYLS